MIVIVVAPLLWSFFQRLFGKIIMNSEKKLQRNKIRTITVVAIMSALSTVLMILEFSVAFVPSFLKFDFSDLPALITSFALGPVCGVIVELLKNVIHLIFSHTGGVGELANFIIGASFVFSAGFVYKIKKDRCGAILGAILGALISSAISFPVNYFITYPFYSNLMPMEQIIDMYSTLIPPANTLTKALVIVNIPFTVIKGLVNTVITVLVYKKLSPILKPKS